MYHAAAEEGLWIVMATVRGGNCSALWPVVDLLRWTKRIEIEELNHNGLALQYMHNTFQISKYT